MKITVGLLLALCVGIGCRWFGIPLPGPPAVMGAAMAVAMATGFTATDYFLTRSSRSASPAANVSSHQPETESSTSASGVSSRVEEPTARLRPDQI
jgi:XapX domain-containing protein